MDPEEFLDENGEWNCIKCGACCNFVLLIQPDLNRGDGTCKNLTEDNLCAIYEDRPALCRVDNFPKPTSKVHAIMCCAAREIVKCRN